MFDAYQNLVTALKASGIPFAEDAWEDAWKLHEDYGTILLDDADVLYANDRAAEQANIGTVDFFTRSDNRAKVARIQAILDSFDDVGWEPGARQYEPKTGMTHYEWIFWVME